MSSEELQWHNKYPQSKEDIRNLISKHCKDISVATVQKLGEGWDNVVWLINKQWCFRLPKHDIAAQLVLNEIKILSNLPKLNLKYPLPKFIVKESSLFPYSFYGHEYLIGNTIDKANLNTEDRIKLAATLGKFLNKLHALPISNAKKLGIGYDALDRINPELRYQHAKERLGYLESHGIIATANPWLDFFAVHKTIQVPDNFVVAHGDLYARHLLVDDTKQLYGVIDWGDSEIMHPAVDLAISYMLFPRIGQKIFWDNYGSVDDVCEILAKLRAIYSSATIGWYGHQIKDDSLMEESIFGLNNILELL